MQTPQFIKRENMISDTEYIQWLSDVKKRFRQSQGRALVKVNAEMLDFYWSIGRDFVVLKAETKWGDGVVKQVAFDMREAFPDVTGFSDTNVKYMKRWYSFYNEQLIKSQRPIDFLSMPELFRTVPYGYDYIHTMLLLMHSVLSYQRRFPVVLFDLVGNAKASVNK